MAAPPFWVTGCGDGFAVIGGTASGGVPDPVGPWLEPGIGGGAFTLAIPDSPDAGTVSECWLFNIGVFLSSVPAAALSPVRTPDDDDGLPPGTRTETSTERLRLGSSGLLVGDKVPSVIWVGGGEALRTTLASLFLGGGDTSIPPSLSLFLCGFGFGAVMGCAVT